MTILSKFLYLLLSLPASPPSSFFQLLKKTFSNFIWHKKCPRLRLSLLYLPYDRGGLQLPNLAWYYWAAQIRASMFYFWNHPLAWVTLESYSTVVPLPSYLHSADTKRLLKLTKNHFMKNTILIWHNALAYLGEKKTLLTTMTLNQAE